MMGKMIQSQRPFASIRDKGIRINNPTIATTTTMTTTFGSVKLWLATTRAAAMLRCAVPSPRTVRVSAAGPPSNWPITKPMAMKSKPARMARVPNKESTLLKFTTTCSAIKTIRPRLEAFAKNDYERTHTSEPLLPY